MMNGIEFGIENGLSGLQLNRLNVTVSDTFTILFHVGEYGRNCGGSDDGDGL